MCPCTVQRQMKQVCEQMMVKIADSDCHGYWAWPSLTHRSYDFPAFGWIIISIHLSFVIPYPPKAWILESIPARQVTDPSKKGDHRETNINTQPHTQQQQFRETNLHQVKVVGVCRETEVSRKNPLLEKSQSSSPTPTDILLAITVRERVRTTQTLSVVPFIDLWKLSE